VLLILVILVAKEEETFVNSLSVAKLLPRLSNLVAIEEDTAGPG